MKGAAVGIISGRVITQTEWTGKSIPYDCELERMEVKRIIFNYHV